MYSDNEKVFGLTAREAFSISTYYDNQTNFLQWHGEFSYHCSVCEPTGFHKIVSQLSSTKWIQMIHNQNVDGLFERAGCLSEKLFNIHGSYGSYRCIGNHKSDEDIFNILQNMREGKASECALNGCLLPVIPNVLFFNDPSFDFQDCNIEILLRTKIDALIIVGTHLDIKMFREVIKRFQKSFTNASTIIVNPMPRNAQVWSRIDYDYYLQLTADQFWLG